MYKTNDLSEYEILRLQNIKRNEIYLTNLGLKKSTEEIRRQHKTQQKRKRRQRPTKRQQGVRVTLSLRKSNRLKNIPVKNYKEDILRIIKDDDLSDSDYDDVSDFGEEIPYPIKRRKRERKATVGVKSTVAATKKIVDASATIINEDILKIERAKTGRSRCRKCLETIEKNELRVGMKAWIMGRNSVTWQHQKCFISNIKIDIASNSRTKCKVSKLPFGVGNLRIGLRSHTATSWVTLECAKRILAPLAKIISLKIIKKLDGFHDKLSKPQQDEITKMFNDVKNNMDKDEKSVDFSLSANSKTMKEEKKKLKDTNGKDSQAQPKKGMKTLTKGNVAWKFGGKFSIPSNCVQYI
jgi:hypothetical protein